VRKWTWGLLPLAIVLGFAAGRYTQPPAAPPAAASPQQPPSDASCLVDEVATRGKTPPLPPPATAVASTSSRLRGRLQLPWQERKKSSYAYAIYAFTADGKVEGGKQFTNTDRFELELGPGRKAVMFYPLLENLSFPFQVVEVPERGEVEVLLRPRVPYLLSGRVVDANGAGVGGVTVVAHETIALPQELYLQGRPAEAAVVEKSSDPVVSPAGPAVEDIVSTYVRIDPLAGRLSRGVTTDAKGHFNLPVTSASDPVPLTVQRGKVEVLKEETVLPGAAPLRIVVPNQ